MMALDWLGSPPVALLIYGLVIYGVLRALTGAPRRSSLYAGGEVHTNGRSTPGYRPFFVFALFFAVAHLGALILATGAPSPIAVLYLAGLGVSLVALILG